MNTKIKTILMVALFVILLGAVYLAYSFLSRNYNQNTSNNKSTETLSSVTKADSVESNTDTKKSAPDFTVTDSQGKQVKLSDFKGKPVVLNFWASWCPPCKGEMPHFNDAYLKYKDNVVFMMVDSVDGQRETQDKGKKYVEGQGYSFPVYFDNNQSASVIYDIMYLPTTIFVDADGKIVKEYNGAIDEKTLNARIEQIIG